MTTRSQRLQEFHNTPLGRRYLTMLNSIPKPEELNMNDRFYFGKFLLCKQAHQFLKNIYGFGMNNTIERWKRLGEDDKRYQVSLTMNHIEEIYNILERLK